MSNSSVHQIIDTLGAESICRRLGVSPYSIKHARAGNKFPASWFNVVSGMCDAKGIKCPHELFNFKSPLPETPLNGGN